jgi:hypothetical protein
MDDVTKITYWIDLIIKALLGIVVTLAGMDYRQVKSSLEELEASKYKLTSQVEIMQSEVRGLEHRLERIEQKLDRILEAKR